MLVFIDESGDPGFKVDKGASPIFVVAMVIFSTAEHAQETQRKIDHVRQLSGHKSEFKFNKCDRRVKDLFFQTIQSCPFAVRSIVVQKSYIYSPRLKTDKERFYHFFVKNMMKFGGGMLEDANVIIDGSGDREFQRSLNGELRKHCSIRSIRFKDSKSDNLIQLADMCAGAIARSYRTDRDEPGRWLDFLRPRVGDIWDFR